MKPAPAVSPPNPKIAGLQKRLATAKKKLEDAKTAGASTRVTLADGSVVTTADEAVGRVILAVYPWDITVATEPPHDSAMNVVHAEVRSITAIGNRARLTIGPITAEITADSVARLGLRPGLPAYATFKATGTRVV